MQTGAHRLKYQTASVACVQLAIWTQQRPYRLHLCRDDKLMIFCH